MEKRYILAVDAGTTGIRCVLLDRKMQIVGMDYRRLRFRQPKPGRVEQDPMELLEAAVSTMRAAVLNSRIKPCEIAAMALTTQRGSTAFWSRRTGEPVYPFVVWLDNRGAQIHKELLQDSNLCTRFPRIANALRYAQNSMFANIAQLLREDAALRSQISDTQVVWGFVDTWLLYQLSQEKPHATSASAAGTQPAYCIKECAWAQEAFERIGLRKGMEPQVYSDCGEFGTLDKSILGVEIPICANIADQQAALFSAFGQRRGTAKCTIGTGLFLDVNVGRTMEEATNLTSFLAWDVKGKKQFLLEGYFSAAGSCLEWAKEQLGLFEQMSDADRLAGSVADNGGVYFVPALAGMDGLPFANPGARGAFMGLCAEANRAHLVRAILESIAYTIAYIFEEIQNSIPEFHLKTLAVDGGGSRSDLICQMVADLTGAKVIRNKQIEATAIGAAQLAAIHLGWFEQAYTSKIAEGGQLFSADQNRRNLTLRQYEMWKKAVDRARDWI